MDGKRHWNPLGEAEEIKMGQMSQASLPPHTKKKTKKVMQMETARNVSAQWYISNLKAHKDND